MSEKSKLGIQTTLLKPTAGLRRVEQAPLGKGVDLNTEGEQRLPVANRRLSPLSSPWVGACLIDRNQT